MNSTALNQLPSMLPIAPVYTGTSEASARQAQMSLDDLAQRRSAGADGLAALGELHASAVGSHPSVDGAVGHYIDRFLDALVGPAAA